MSPKEVGQVIRPDLLRRVRDYWYQEQLMWQFSNCGRTHRVLPVVMAIFLSGCCQLGLTCYELYIIGEPKLNDADIYVDNKLVKSSVNGSATLHLSWETHEVKVVQKGFKPYEIVIEGKGGRSERGLKVKFEPLNAVDTVHTP